MILVTSHFKIEIESVAFIRMMRAAYWSSDLRTMTKVIKITRRASSCEAHRGGAAIAMPLLWYKHLLKILLWVELERCAQF